MCIDGWNLFWLTVIFDNHHSFNKDCVCANPRELLVSMPVSVSKSCHLGHTSTENENKAMKRACTTKSQIEIPYSFERERQWRETEQSIQEEHLQRLKTEFGRLRFSLTEQLNKVSPSSMEAWRGKECSLETLCLESGMLFGKCREE